MTAGECSELPWQEIAGMRCHKVEKPGLWLGVAKQLGKLYLCLMGLHGFR